MYSPPRGLAETAATSVAETENATCEKRIGLAFLEKEESVIGRNGVLLMRPCARYVKEEIRKGGKADGAAWLERLGSSGCCRVL